MRGGWVEYLKNLGMVRISFKILFWFSGMLEGLALWDVLDELGSLEQSEGLRWIRVVFEGGGWSVDVERIVVIEKTNQKINLKKH